MSKLKIDQLVLIGNGFDQSIGFSTGFQAFFHGLIRKEFSKILKNNKETDNESFMGENPLFRFHMKGVIMPHVFEFFIKDNTRYMEDFHEHFTQNRRVFFKYKSAFIERLMLENVDHWGSVEALYFQCLLQAHHDKTIAIKTIHLLNEQLSYLKRELVAYLSPLKMSPNKPHEFQGNEFMEGFENLLQSNDAASHVYGFINFNYTHFLKEVLSRTKRIDAYELISIHGAIEDKDTDALVFGYGNEDTKDCKRIKKAGLDAALKNIKTYSYLGNTAYAQVSELLSNANEFQVLIYGYSCAVSDTLLLREIFEHEKCVAIRILHHGGPQEYQKILFNSSRIFKENRKVREKVAPFDSLDGIPQAILSEKISEIDMSI